MRRDRPALGLGFGLLRPSEQPPTPASSLDPNRLESTITFLVASLSLALGPSGLLLVACTNTALTGKLLDLTGMLTYVTLALIAGLPIVLGVTTVLPWGRYQLTHLILALRGGLPWRLFAFLEDAHQRALLRQVGGVYQFRHARLQDRLGAP